jgi:hypothetical protein
VQITEDSWLLSPDHSGGVRRRVSLNGARGIVRIKEINQALIRRKVGASLFRGR